MSATEPKWSYVFDEPTRILVVDDDPILHEFAIVHLTAPLCQVETVPNALAALDLLTRAEFDLVLVDIEMPGMDGFELVRNIRNHEKQKGTLRRLPLVMQTGREDIASIDLAYAAGATSFVTKPINWRQLSYQLRCIIRASKWAREAREVRGGAGMPVPLLEDIVRSLNAIVDQAGLIHGVADVGHAGEIAAIAQSTLHKLLAPADGAAVRDQRALHLGLRPVTGSAA